MTTRERYPLRTRLLHWLTAVLVLTTLLVGFVMVNSLGSYAAFDSVQAAVARPYRPSMRLPSGTGRHYYILMLDVEMLSVNDIDEVERWLRGELSPAVRGEHNPGTAISRGAKTLVTRLLGGRSQHYEARSRVFRGR